jgi:hypothetical protein
MNDESKTSDKQDFFLLCAKCIKVSRLLNKSESKGFSEIILQKMTIDDLLPYVHDNWSTASEFHDFPPHDFRLNASYEFTIFEHVLLYRLWYKLMEQAHKRKLTEELYS